MLIKRPSDIPSSEITDEKLYWNRRAFIRAAAGVGAVALGAAVVDRLGAAGGGAGAAGFGAAGDSGEEELTPYESVTTYNNFYEFGMDKGDPAKHAHSLRPRPWSVEVTGEVHRPRVYEIDELLKAFPQEERIYRLRCVEAWSMVIPWQGFPLAALLQRVEPTSHARFVEFTTLYDPEQMPGQRRGILPWPYVEGLRLDEAMHPLTILATGLYGKALPNQNGAPLRLVVPWKYGFKSIKSIVRIRLTREQPRTTWNLVAPHEYGFYANVNPAVDHPRWSQKRERRIGEWVKRPTLFLNGYAAEVGHLYAGMDLRKNF